MTDPPPPNRARSCLIFLGIVLLATIFFGVILIPTLFHREGNQYIKPQEQEDEERRGTYTH